MQWESDLIGYNALNSYGSPSYYAQVMFASTVGTEIVDIEAGGRRAALVLLSNEGSGEGLADCEGGEWFVNRAAGGIQAGRREWREEPGQGDEPDREHDAGDEPNYNAEENCSGSGDDMPGVGANFKHVVPAYTIQVIEIATN